MKTQWQEAGEDKAVTAPLSLVISAFAAVQDVRQTVTPQLRTDQGESRLLLVDLGAGQNRLGGSSLAQVYRHLGQQPADADAKRLAAFYSATQQLVREAKLLAYHDRSDGGLMVTLAEMAFAGHCGVEVDIDGLGKHAVEVLFNEELGALLQVREADVEHVLAAYAEQGLHDCVQVIGQVNADNQLLIRQGEQVLMQQKRSYLRTVWAETTYHMQRLRDNPACAEEEFKAKQQHDDPGLSAQVSFDINDNI